MNFFEAIIQGIIQGLTEFLPVSSSGHLSIAQHVMGVTEDNLFFNVMLHIGTLVAVCVFYHKLIWKLIKEFISLVKDLFTGKFKWKTMNYDRSLIMMLIIGLIPLFLLFIPIPFAGGINAKDLADIWTGNKYFIIVGFSLLITSVLLTIGIIANKRTAERYKKKGILREDGSSGRRKLNPGDAVCIGLIQCIAAVFPGISRSGSTLTMGEVRGLNKQTALDFTFILAIPSILAAAVLEFKDAIAAPEGISINIGIIIVGMITAAVVGYFSIVLFKWLLKTDKMWVFAIYTAVVGIAVIIISIIELNNKVNIFTGIPL